MDTFKAIKTTIMCFILGQLINSSLVSDRYSLGALNLFWFKACGAIVAEEEELSVLVIFLPTYFLRKEKKKKSNVKLRKHSENSK